MYVSVHIYVHMRMNTDIQKIHFKLHQSSFNPFYPRQSLDFMDFTFPVSYFIY